MRQNIRNFVEHKWFKGFIVAILVINGVVLGLETTKGQGDAFYRLVYNIDAFILGLLTIEVSLRIYAHGFGFFKRSWNIFDFVVTAIALIPAAGPFAIIRALRILRLFRIFSSIPRLQKVINTIVHSIPGIMAILAVILIMFYVFAVMGTSLFAEDFPVYFENIAVSMFTLFQIMTGESWASGIARPIMDVYPYAWIYFISFILITTITLLNLIVVVLLTTMQDEDHLTSHREGDPEDFDPTKLRSNTINL